MYFALVVLTLIVGASLALSTVLISQIRIVRGMERSVAAFYAADTGIEHALSIIMRGGTITTMGGGGNLENQTNYEYLIRLVPAGSVNPLCGLRYSHYCITSTGVHSPGGGIVEVRRVIKAGN